MLEDLDYFKFQDVLAVEVGGHRLIRAQAADGLNLLAHEIHGLAGYKALPIQIQSMDARLPPGRGRDDLVPIRILFGPKSGPIGLV